MKKKPLSMKQLYQLLADYVLGIYSEYPNETEHEMAMNEMERIHKFLDYVWKNRE